MKLERINDNQIRCTLSGIDLQSLNINIFELTYGSEKTQNLFKEMLSRASRELGFHTEDFPLMVEAIPTSSDSIVIIITKVDDPDELDSRFAKFAPLHEDLPVSSADEIPGYEPLEGLSSLSSDSTNHTADKAEKTTDDLDAILNSTITSSEIIGMVEPESIDEMAKAFIKKVIENEPHLLTEPDTLSGADTSSDVESGLKSEKKEWQKEEGNRNEDGNKDRNKDEKENARDVPAHKDYKIFVFDSLDRIVDAAKVISKDVDVSSTLYKNPEQGRYYLVLSDPTGENRGFTNICNLLSEYGQKISPHYLSTRYYEEHFELLIKKRALENLALL